MLTDLKQKFTDANATFDEALLQRRWQEIESYLLHVINGVQIKVCILKGRKLKSTLFFFNNLLLIS